MTLLSAVRTPGRLLHSEEMRLLVHPYALQLLVCHRIQRNLIAIVI